MMNKNTRHHVNNNNKEQGNRYGLYIRHHQWI